MPSLAPSTLPRPSAAPARDPPPRDVSAALRAVPEAPGAASGASNTSRQAGGALGVAIFATLSGAANASHFTAHCVTLFASGAAIFAITAVLCSTVFRRFEGLRA